MGELLVMRHAKSDWNAPYGSDHDRPLAPRGVRSARIMGRYLESGANAPDLVISSTATRAITTALLASEAGSWNCDVVQDGRLYGGARGDVLQAISDHADDAKRVMVVGHEPTWSGLVLFLTGASVEMKTASVACVDLNGALLDEVAPGSGALKYLIQSRDLFGSEWDTD